MADDSSPESTTIERSTSDETSSIDEASGKTTQALDRLPQEVVITDAGPCLKHVKVTIDRAVIDARLEEKFRDLMLETPAQVPGFRPGKAPRRIVEKKFRKEVSNEVRNEILMASLEQLAEESAFSPLSPPKLDPASVILPEEGPLVYEFDIEVRPEFDLPEYRGLKLRKPVRRFTDIDRLKMQRRLLEPFGQIVPKDGPVELNDQITADLKLSYDGKVLGEYKEIVLKVEKRLALADGVANDFGQSIVGGKAGDIRKFEIVLSQELANPQLRGVTIEGELTIKDVKTIRLPELTPDILAHFGLRTPEQFQELIEIRLNRYLEHVQRKLARAQILEQLAGNANWEMPQDLLLRQAREMLKRRILEMRDLGISDDQIKARLKVMEQDALQTTMASLKEHFVLQKIAELEKIEIDDDAIDEEIEAIAERTGENPRKVRARLEKEDLMEALATEILERKALDLVLSSATYEEYPWDDDSESDDDVATVPTPAVS
jgi:trigger factor